jgi:hypothetical protein
MHRDLAKLLELGVDEQWLIEINITPTQARGLLMGILYLREMYPHISTKSRD